MKLNWLSTFKALIIIFSILLLSTILLNTLYYFDVLGNNAIKYFKLIFSMIAFLIGGLYMGMNSPNKGYIYGLRLSLIVIIIFLIFGVIFNNLEVKRIIYYLIITFCITFGSMIGINKKTI